MFKRPRLATGIGLLAQLALVIVLIFAATPNLLEAPASREQGGQPSPVAVTPVFDPAATIVPQPANPIPPTPERVNPAPVLPSAAGFDAPVQTAASDPVQPTLAPYVPQVEPVAVQLQAEPVPNQVIIRFDPSASEAEQPRPNCRHRPSWRPASRTIT
jgi:hypothetical protein